MVSDLLAAPNGEPSSLHCGFFKVWGAWGGLGPGALGEVSACVPLGA
jgi:hypothetical protein